MKLKLDGSPVHRTALCEHLWVWYFAQRYFGSAWKVFGSFPYYQNTFHPEP